MYISPKRITSKTRLAVARVRVLRPAWTTWSIRNGVHAGCGRWVLPGASSGSFWTPANRIGFDCPPRKPFKIEDSTCVRIPVGRSVPDREAKSP